MAKANVAKNYFAIAHPSLTNYLEVVGGSNFNILSDNYPDWHNATCIHQHGAGHAANSTTRHRPGLPDLGGTGTDAATPALDYTNETSAPAPRPTSTARCRSPRPRTSTATRSPTSSSLPDKKLEELPGRPAGDRRRSASTSATATSRTRRGTQRHRCRPSTRATRRPNIVYLYAVKHNPFAYFKRVQEATSPHQPAPSRVAVRRPARPVRRPEGRHVPNFSFIAPNQCNDSTAAATARRSATTTRRQRHADRPEPGADPAGRPGAAAHRHRHQGFAACGRRAATHIVILWDENDYSTAHNQTRCS